KTISDPPWPVLDRKKAASLVARSLEGTDEVSSLQFVREQDHLLAGGPELFDVLVLDATELRLQRRGFLALAIRRKRDRPDDGLVLVLAQIFGDALLVERLGRTNRRVDHLAHRIAERRQIIAERIDLGLDGLAGVLLQT